MVFSYGRRRPLPTFYTPPYITVPSPPTGSCHFLYDDFIARFPERACDAEGVCEALTFANNFAHGFTTVAKRNEAIHMVAAHFLKMREISVTEGVGRQIAMTQGAVAPPAAGSPEYDTWLGLSVYGQAYKALVGMNGRVSGIIA